MIKRFIIYGLLGWSIEVFWTGLSSLLNGDLRLGGYSNLWMFFIYGCAVFLEPIHDIIYKWRWIARGFIWLLIIWGLEYTSGFIMGNVLGIFPWVYTGAYTIDGLIRLDFAPAWFAAGILFERVHKTLDMYNVA